MGKEKVWEEEVGEGYGNGGTGGDENGEHAMEKGRSKRDKKKNEDERTKKINQDAQRQYVVIGTLAPIC